MAVSNAEFNKYAKHLESKPLGSNLTRCERYSRVVDQAAYEDNLEAIFGRRSIEDVKKRAGRTRKVYKF